MFQLGDGDFPPLRSLYRTNLPVPATPFLGREADIAEIVGLLQQDVVRLLTLTGPGGTGKTRLALQAAAEAAESFPDGLWWVPLSALRDPNLLVPSLAQTLLVEEQPGRELFEGLAARLTGMRALVILDNAEHLLPEVADEIARLRDVGGPKILVTSRERLQLQGEHLYAVPTLERDDGVELFVTRARALGSGVEESAPVVELCSRLDNLPLAIELAAARTIVFTPEQLLERISQRLDLLKAGRDADPRQQTLRATIDWSYDLLDEGEQKLFRGLSVFAGGSTYEGAEVVCRADPDRLQSLLDKSLLRRTDGAPGPRYWMLETIRELAAEKLDAEGESRELRRLHAEHYLAVARSANLDAESLGAQRHDLVIPERDNMRAALDWALESDERELGLELVVALENYWATNAPTEGLEWAATLLDGASGVPELLVVRALRVQGGMENGLGNYDRAEQLWEQALAIARALDEKTGGGGPPPPALARRDGPRRLRADASVCGGEPRRPPRGRLRERSGTGAELPRGRRSRRRRSREGARAPAREQADRRRDRLSLVALRSAREHRFGVRGARQARRRTVVRAASPNPVAGDERPEGRRLRARVSWGRSAAEPATCVAPACSGALRRPRASEFRSAAGSTARSSLNRSEAATPSSRTDKPPGTSCRSRRRWRLPSAKGEGEASLAAT